MSVFAFIPLLPLLAFLVISLGGKRLGKVGHRIGVPAVGLSAALTIGAFYRVAVDGPISIALYRLIDVGPTLIDVNLYVDQLTVLLLLLVTGGSFIVHVYSSSYMIGDPKYQRFFAVMALFTFAMVMLVMSNNLLVTYMCWEVMGICSYLLISHWAHREASAQAATKAFLVNAIADVGLGFGVV
jgi:NADH-quinone oxidoreductase subunit L